jgi:hypothetical protein
MIDPAFYKSTDVIIAVGITVVVVGLTFLRVSFSQSRVRSPEITGREFHNKYALFDEFRCLYECGNGSRRCLAVVYQCCLDVHVANPIGTDLESL